MSTRTTRPTPPGDERKSRRVLWINLGAVAAFIIVAVIVVLALRPSTPTAEPAAADPAPTVRADTRILGEPGTADVTLVEFLDFECEACGATYPYIEQLREKYAGDVTFAIRYFPLPGHKNSENAAIAVEAAARQGQLEAMYSRMFDTQIEWGEKQESQAALFRSFAVELGLDMDAYDEAIADPTTLARVRSDLDDGVALGVRGTPTFFVNDERLELTALEDLDRALDEALGR